MTIKYDKEADVYISYSEKYDLYSQGRTRMEAKIALEDAIESYIECNKKLGIEV